MYRCCRCCIRRENKVDTVEPEKKHDFAVSYNDMENLLEEFHACQGILKQQLKDLDKKKGQDASDGDDNAMEPIE